MRDKVYKILLAPVRVLSSKAFLVWIIGCWIVYYVVSSIWLRESFGDFAGSLQTKQLIRIPYLLFLTSGCLNFIRSFRETIGKGKTRAIARAVLPLGLMIFAAGYYISLTSRQFDWIIVGEG